MIFELDIKDFEARRELIRSEEYKYPLRFYESPIKYCLYITDIDGKTLKTTVLKSSFSDRVDERNFKMEYVDRGLRIIKEVPEEIVETEEYTNEEVEEAVSCQLRTRDHA